MPCSRMPSAIIQNTAPGAARAKKTITAAANAAGIHQKRCHCSSVSAVAPPRKRL